MKSTFYTSFECSFEKRKIEERSYFGKMWSGRLEEAFIISGLFIVQCIFGVYMVFLNRVLSMGVNSLFLIILASLASAIILLPLAIALEKKNWPSRITPLLMLEFAMLALGGVVIYEVLSNQGIKKTSPAVASAMPNLSPGFIFIIASCLNVEKFEWRCKYTKAKIFGTLMCLSGAMAMSFLTNNPSSTEINQESYQDWILGCFYLLCGVTARSCNNVLQAVTLGNFPAPLTMCVITSVLASLFTAILQVVTVGKIDAGTSEINLFHLIQITTLAGLTTGGCVAFQTWCVEKKGPVIVSLFSPFQTVCSAFISFFLYKQSVSLGCLAGIILMFGGLYIVLWAKNKEDLNPHRNEDTNDIEKRFVS